jgi:hypothetical protein
VYHFDVPLSIMSDLVVIFLILRIKSKISLCTCHALLRQPPRRPASCMPSPPTAPRWLSWRRWPLLPHRRPPRRARRTRLRQWWQTPSPPLMRQRPSHVRRAAMRRVGNGAYRSCAPPNPAHRPHDAMMMILRQRRSYCWTWRGRCSWGGAAARSTKGPGTTWTNARSYLSRCGGTE